jgi:hypothetical protein
MIWHNKGVEISFPLSFTIVATLLMRFTKRQARWKEPVIQKVNKVPTYSLCQNLHRYPAPSRGRSQVAAEFLTVSKMVNRASHQRPIGEANDSMSTEANSYTSTSTVKQQSACLAFPCRASPDQKYLPSSCRCK